MLEIHSYKELQKYIKAFGEKKLNSLIVISRGGLGKTHLALENVVRKDPLFLSGHLTSLEFYKRLYRKNAQEEDFLLVLDDLDAFLSNAINVSLLKQVSDTKENKLVKYNTTSPRLDKDEASFTTRCKTLVLMNQNPRNSTNNNIQALLDRSHVIRFTPTNQEILNKIKEFATDKKIIKFLENHINTSEEISLRSYARAEDLKSAGLDWEKSLIQELSLNSKFVEIRKLFENHSSDNERIKKFSGGRATYFRTKKEFLKMNPEFNKKSKSGTFAN